MSRDGSVIATFDTIVLYTSELIEVKFNQDWNIKTHPTVSNINLTNPGALSLGVIDLTLKMTSDVNIILPIIFDLFRNKKLATLTAMGLNFGLCYFSSLDFTITQSDEVMKPLFVDIDATFTQSNEQFI